MALLKKRALAEFSQVIQEEAPKVSPQKKLRLVKKAPVFSGVDLEQLKSTSPAEALNLLIQLSENLPDEVEEVQQMHQLLQSELHRVEQESAVKVKIISIFKTMVEKKLIEPADLLDNLLPVLKSDGSHKVTNQILVTLHAVGKASVAEGRLQLRILQLAKQFLLDVNYQVKCTCLDILSDFTPVDSTTEASVSTLVDYSRNQDARVRTCALDAMLRLNERGTKLDFSTYEEACTALDDDYEGVRMASLRLISVLARIYSEQMVKTHDEQETIRLADDAFIKICNSVNDLSMNVRVLAASLLGSMTNISLHFLEQTLDKKLMSNLRKKRSAHERQKESFESGEWSSGKKWADDAPKEAVNADTISLMSTGACGAFVHGLEDEFMEVRNASLGSLCQLAVKFPSFAGQSLDFLVDMFNDEIEEVRLNVICCLGRVSEHIVLREDQLDTILAVLEDFSMDIREALHEMLGSCNLSTKTGLKSCIDNLLENLKRYPQDKNSIWKCLQKLGAHHPYLTLPLVPELLGIHPFLELPEPDIEDPAYVSILILVFNAVTKCPTMMSLFEEHTLRHHAYLRDSFPSLVPPLKLPNQTCSPQSPVSSLAHSREFLKKVLDRVASAENRHMAARMTILDTCIADLKRLSEIEPSLSAAANCASLYIQCQLLFLKVMSNRNWMNPSALSPLQSGALKALVDQLLNVTFCLTHRFLGLQAEEVATLGQLRLRSLAMQLVIVIRSNTSALALCEVFLDRVEALQSYIDEHNLQPDTFTSAVFRELDALEDPKPGSVARVLQPLLQAHPCPAVQLHGTEGLEHVRQTGATIHEPTGESDNALKFTAGLVVGVTFDARIENVEDVKSVRVKVKYPDQQVQLILPQLTDFRHQGDQQYRLYTTILLSHSVWSEACHVEMSLVLDFSDAEGGSGKSGQRTSGGKLEEQLCIQLCKPVQVYIAPKPVKKGI